MKMLITAIALAFAMPAVAQTAPAKPPAGPAQQSAPADSCTPEHAAMGHCASKAAAAAAADPHAGHDMKDGCCDKDAAGKMACCAKAKASGTKMECCEKMDGGATDAPAAPSGH